MLRCTSLVAALCGLALLAPLGAAAQESNSDETEIATEEPDPTRLDVERLPPEAIEVSRDLYAHGFFVEGQIGGRGFINGIGDISDGGLWASLGFGYEIADFFHVLIAAEGSMHNTSGPAPPAASAYELLGGSASLRLQGNFTEAFALWISGTFAVLIATTDILEQYGFVESTDIGISYGGEVGADWHLRARHFSLGLLAGVRHFPSLERAGQSGPTLGIHGSAYLRYVF